MSSPNKRGGVAMMGRTHAAVGMASCLLALDAGAVAHGGILADASLVLAGVIGALLPDLDHPKSTAGSMLPFVSVPLSAMFGHRGATHSLLAAGLCFALGTAAAQAVPSIHSLPAFALGLAIGWLSHLAADMLNPAGAPLLWPHPRRFRFPLPSSPNGLLDSLLFWASAICSVVLIVRHSAPSI
ncbi:metal-dependent hydrolase [Magnetospirillum sp. ME-1]|uniref:metal-dependent hydrolase n=1 Tax=Magnetospirillum sp. ME-1 TaxID=1639348 RepID=UPI00143D0D56|nr:metal-dependent hydrolase [Magnetospirillum sp. ME-1]